MPKNNITEYDSTASNNTDVGGVNLQENSCLPSDMNNAIREVMSHLKDVDSGTQALTALSVTGNITANANLTVSGAFTSQGIDDNADANAITITSDEKVGIGVTTPNRRLVIGGQAEMSIQNNDMSADRRNFNFFLTGDKGHMRMLNDAGNAGGTSVSIDNDGIMDGACFTGDYGTCFGMLDSSTIGDSNIPYNSFGTPNSTYYRWVLPKAGTYLLSSNLRVRMWGVFGYIKARLYNNTTSTAIEGGNLTGTTLGSNAHIRMLLENSSANNPEYLNVNITANYMITTSADNQDIHHQLNTTDNSTNTSIQSDVNGRNVHYWQRIG